MSCNTAREALAEAYAAFRADVGAALPTAADSAWEWQRRWACGECPTEGRTRHHGPVRIVEPGSWNRGEGADFLRAEIELNGQRIRGDIQLSLRAEDWERCAEQPAFNDVILHVVQETPPETWYTRNAAHREVPVFCLSHPQAAPAEDGVDAPLSGANTDTRLLSLATAAAAYRLEEKRRRFRHAAEKVGLSQAWFEAWAQTLGYAANKHAMQMLARRAPLQSLTPETGEAILFGTAGFLVPVLPERCTAEARSYHRRLWDAWWPLQDAFRLSPERALPWVLSPVRPLNHPQRRVAALALSALHWPHIEPHLSLTDLTPLRRLLTALRHPYWDTHCTLPSAPLRGRCALVGKQRTDDFLLNHLYAQDSGESAWQSYLRLQNRSVPAAILESASRLCGPRESHATLLQHSYMQQGLLQLAADFRRRDGRFSAALADWRV